MESIRHKTQGSMAKKTSLADELGLTNHSRTPSRSASRTPKSMQTNFQEKVAAELWMNIGGKDFRLVGKSIRIGRAEDNDIVLDHKSVSRYHALLTIQNNQVIFEDLKSRNGVRVGGARVKRAELKDNDEVGVGDLEGVFFQRLKKQSHSAKAPAASKKQMLGNLLDGIRFSSAIEKFQDLDMRKKRMAFAGIIISILSLWLLFGKTSTVNLPMATVGATAATEPDLKPSDRRSYERCIEAEDLGNFRQASTCYKNLAQTPEVQTAIERVKKVQSEISERRFKEGKQAFDNYYYDMAILKFQEVLLVSDDSSEYRHQAMRAIQDAEEKKKRQ